MKRVFKKIIVWILTVEARLVLLKYKPKVVGVTGSVGKTSTKDAIYTVLSSHFYSRKSEKSYNSEIGIPLTILGLENAWSNPFLWLKNIFQGLAMVMLHGHYPSWLVLEVGLDRPGDIERIVRWLKLDVAVFTRLAKIPVHVEFFESPQELKREKKKLVNGLKDGAVLIVNGDDEELVSLRNMPAPKWKLFTYGIENVADVRATNDHTTYSKGSERIPTGINFKANYRSNVVPVSVPGVLGRQHIYPILAGVAAGVSQGINLVDVSEALRDYKTAPGRMKILKGGKETVIIDDTYNSSPVALEEALRVLEKVKSSGSGRKIAVLGDMMELGKHTTDEHRAIGERVKEAADVLVTVGLRAHYIAEGAHKAGMYKKNIFEFDTSESASEKISGLVETGDTLLIKGSQSVRMERIVESIMEEPERADELLVRQGREWLARP